MYNKTLPIDEKNSLVHMKASFAPKNLEKFEARETEVKQALKKILILVLDKSGSMGDDFEKLRGQAIDLGRKIDTSNFSDFYCIAYSDKIEAFKYQKGNFAAFEEYCNGLKCTNGNTQFEKAFDEIHEILKNGNKN
jgi:uncharacterized protein with von Willebrand factor type A (vWA) domain